MTFEQQAKIQRLEKALGYTYQNKDFLLRALTHRSVGAKNNERLEFLGDSLVNFMIADILYHQFEKISEGDLSRIRAHLVKGDTV
jgi:ribonuclease III